MKTIVAACALCFSASIAFAECAPDRVDLRGDWGSARFSVEVVDTPQGRAEGLMHRESMAKSAGMLFVYEFPQTVAFWMKNTLIPLDMIFMSPDGVVQHIHENAIPGDLTNIPGGEGIQYVLEINGGMASLLGIEDGSQMRHPSLDAAVSAWPCDG